MISGEKIKEAAQAKGKEMIRLGGVLRGLNIPVDVDVLVYSEAEIEKRRNWCTTPVYGALREGKVLYDTV